MYDTATIISSTATMTHNHLQPTNEYNKPPRSGAIVSPRDPSPFINPEIRFESTSSEEPEKSTFDVSKFAGIGMTTIGASPNPAHPNAIKNPTMSLINPNASIDAAKKK